MTHDLSAKVDASLKANLGFSGKYLVVVGHESANSVVRLRLYKQSTKGLNFGFNLDVGVQGSDPQLPTSFENFIQSIFGVHGLQVLNDLRQWTDPSADLGQKLAGLTEQTALHLLKETVPNIDPAAEFDRAKQALADALNTWTSLPGKLSSMLWTFIGQKDPTLEAEFKAFLSGLANPQTTEKTILTTLKKVTFGDSPRGQFLEAIADRVCWRCPAICGPSAPCRQGSRYPERWHHSEAPDFHQPEAGSSSCPSSSARAVPAAAPARSTPRRADAPPDTL